MELYVVPLGVDTFSRITYHNLIIAMLINLNLIVIISVIRIIFIFL